LLSEHLPLSSQRAIWINKFKDSWHVWLIRPVKHHGATTRMKKASAKRKLKFNKKNQKKKKKTSKPIHCHVIAP
jgi:hypothetical protein